MDMSNQKSTAGVRQFESTAIAKLMARGVPKHIASAFVKIGLDKSGRKDQLKEVVCKMEYRRFFIPSTVADFKDPLRIGSYVPHLVESKESTFHCEFQMSDIESAKFAKLFPEFNVTARGRVHNQHAFYANKRYAEAEILVGMVYSDSKKTGLNPESIIDLGGNDSWHEKKNRLHVHCDNPIMSVRDKMRYITREVFSGSNRKEVCQKKFGQCEHIADYAIGVHSTYDMTPNQIAHAMHRKKIKRFFGVVNYIPGIETKPAGVYESDGIEMQVFRPTRGSATFSCGFSHDPSLRYVHNLSTLRKYLQCQQQCTVVDSEGVAHPYTYTIRSVRGNSVVFSIDDIPRGVGINSTSWSQPYAKSYNLSLDFLGVKDLNVDCEFFDRIVLRAASARNDSQFDIVSLFRYAKSLRQRVSIGSIVLSSGFTYNSDDLVSATIAAYATAMAYRRERSNFFKTATSQIMHQRYNGFFKDVVTVAVDVLKVVVSAIPVAFAYYSGLMALDEKIKQMVRSGSAVTVEIVKPNLGKGMSYDPSMFARRSVYTRLITLKAEGTEITPYSKYYGATLLPTRVKFGDEDTTLFSRGLISYDPYELPRVVTDTTVYDLGSVDIPANGSVESCRSVLYSRLYNKLRMVKRTDEQALVVPNGDRMYRAGLSQIGGLREMQGENMSFVSNKRPYVIFRGIGRYVVSVKPPRRYSEGCYGFYLFFESRVNSSKLVGHTILDSPVVDEFSYGISQERSSYLKNEQSSWDVVGNSPGPDSEKVKVVTFATEDEGVKFVHESADNGEYFMSGAIPDDQPLMDLLTPPDDHDGFIRDKAVSTLGFSNTLLDEDSLSVVNGDSFDFKTVSSADVVTGLNAMEEYVKITDVVCSNALAGAKSVIDMARSAAQGDAPKHYFLAAASQLPGNLRAVKLSYDGDTPVLHDNFSDQPCDHMAVSDGVTVFDLLVDKPPLGVYVTSDSFLVYTGGAIASSVRLAQTISYECPVTCLDGIAGSGKTYHIIKNAGVNDVVLCETKYALADTAKELDKKVSGWKGHAYTVDSYLMHRQVTDCEVLWIDEAFRLHAGKLYALVKLLKPRTVYCFGDSKQIPSLSFVPGYDYVYHDYPFSSIVLKKDTWRFGADVCFGLSTLDYYGYHATTHVPVLYSMSGPSSFVQGSLHNKKDYVVILTYTKTARDDLLSQGVKNVMTIGQSQGKTFDSVILYRDSGLNKALYYDKFQALVAVTRHRKSFEYVTVVSVFVDDSAVAKLLNYVKTNGNEIVLSSHVIGRSVVSRDYSAYESKVSLASEQFSYSEQSLPPEVTSVGDDWELFSDDD